MKKQLFNVVSQEVIDLCISDYNSREVYQTASMNKAPPGQSLDVLVEICEKTFGDELIYCSGNFYKHSFPYLPHTDYRENQDNTINAVIPLQYSGEQASLIVFDQRWVKDSITWCLSGPTYKYSVNTGVSGNPCDYEVEGLTHKPIVEEFYQKYLSKYSKECYFGLSGNAYLFEPGSIIFFDNKLIHCTSNFSGEKLGISLRFK